MDRGVNLIIKAPAIVRPTPGEPRDLRLTQKQAKTFLGARETPHVRLFVVLALTTAGRMGAILDLTWDRVDFEHKTIDLNNPARLKAREALLAAREGALTDRVIEWNAKPVASVKQALRRNGQNCGLPGCRLTSSDTRRPHGWLRMASTWRASQSSWAMRTRR